MSYRKLSNEFPCKERIERVLSVVINQHDARQLFFLFRVFPRKKKGQGLTHTKKKTS